jgi:2-keto-4-pentenoate hydratase/2-oxohepta-3-ene-1,7-dioic acid hydratase in catechol pathway
MRLISYQSPTGSRPAALREDGAVDLNRADPTLPACMKRLLALGPEGLQRARQAMAKGQPMPLEGLQLVPPVPFPDKVICIGLNYADHAKETGQPLPSEPVVFCKFPTTVRAQGDPIVIPKASAQVDYEAELVVVLGQGGRHIPEAEARRHVAAYCCGNDVSARDWQIGKTGGQWLLGKSFDSFAPFGPALVTADEVPDPGNLKIQLRLNGQTMQDSSTAQLIFSVDKLIAYLSTVCTLAPGDLIFTGTPPGVGMARKPPVFLKPGDVTEVEIAGLGVLRNALLAEE